jgi:hypothetical protein
VKPYTTGWAWGFCSLVLLLSSSASAEKIRPGEYLMPSTSQGFLAVAHAENLIEHYNRTELGKLTSDPVMEPFTKDVRRQFESRWSGIHERLGLTLHDLRDMAGGEVSVALIKPDEDPLQTGKGAEESGMGDPNLSAIALVVDVTGKVDVARKKLEEIKKFFTDQGAKFEKIKVPESTEPVWQFTLPIPEEEREAESSQFGGVKPATGEKNTPALPKPSAPKPRMAIYFLAGNLFGAADDPEILRGILARAYGREGDALADVPSFQKVMERCRADGNDPPQIRWFMYPVGYASAMRASTPEAKRRKGKSILEMLRNQGFTGVRGIGGHAAFSAEGFDLVHRTVVYAPPPYENSMKMLKFFNRQDYTPQDWVPRDVATYATFYFDILNAFDNFDALYDELTGGGNPELWRKTLQDFKEDLNGPQIDLREELIKLLNERITIVTDYQTPIELNSERILVAIEVSDETAVAKAIEKSFRGDSGAKMQEIKGLQIWEIVENQEEEFGPPKVDLGGDAPPPLTPLTPKKKLLQREQGQDRLFPHAAITVTRGHLFIASHPDFLWKILGLDETQPREARELLRNDPDYQTIAKQIDRLPPEEKCLHFFSRTDEEYRPTYELVRQNKMPESENMLARLLNAMFGEGKKGAKREPKLDGSALPEYEVVRHYLRPAGLLVAAEENGWFLKGFTLSKGDGAAGEESTAEKKSAEEKGPAAEEKTVVKTPATEETPTVEPPAPEEPAAKESKAEEPAGETSAGD